MHDLRRRQPTASSAASTRGIDAAEVPVGGERLGRGAALALDGPQARVELAEVEVAHDLDDGRRDLEVGARGRELRSHAGCHRRRRVAPPQR